MLELKVVQWDTVKIPASKLQLQEPGPEDIFRLKSKYLRFTSATATTETAPDPVSGWIKNPYSLILEVDPIEFWKRCLLTYSLYGDEAYIQTRRLKAELGIFVVIHQHEEPNIFAEIRIYDLNKVKITDRP
jgi:hypothetical protein